MDKETLLKSARDAMAIITKSTDPRCAAGARR